MNKKLTTIWIGLLAVFLFSGCVTTEEDLNRLSGGIASNSREVRALSGELSDLRTQMKLRDAEIERRLDQTRQSLPDMRIELDRLRLDIQRLTNLVELSQQQGTLTEAEGKAFHKEITFAKQRLDRIEANLSLPPLSPSDVQPIEAADQPVVVSGQSSTQVTVSSQMKPQEQEVEPEAEQSAPTPEDRFNQAKTLLDKGLYPAAFQKFKDFIQEFPQSSFAPSAQVLRRRMSVSSKEV